MITEIIRPKEGLVWRDVTANCSVKVFPSKVSGYENAACVLIDECRALLMEHQESCEGTLRVISLTNKNTNVYMTLNRDDVWFSVYVDGKMVNTLHPFGRTTFSSLTVKEVVMKMYGLSVGQNYYE